MPWNRAESGNSFNENVKPYEAADARPTARVHRLFPLNELTATSMSDAPVETEPAQFTKLRTTIIVVSMIVMPLCAVVGVKVPKFINDLTTESVGVTNNADAKPKPVAKATGTGAPADRDRSKSKPLDRAVSLAQAEAGHSGHDHADHGHDHAAPAAVSYAALASQSGSPFPGSQHAFPTANSDVRATQSGVSQAVALEAMTASAPPVGFDTAGAIRPLPPAEEQGRSYPTPSAAAPTGDQFSLIQTRLKALGATHYTLETWGAGGNSYRFQCRMAAGHSADYTRQFEATDTDALRTMQTVLDEVEAWKAGRLP